MKDGITLAALRVVTGLRSDFDCGNAFKCCMSVSFSILPEQEAETTGTPDSPNGPK